MSATRAYNRGHKKRVNWLSCKWCECDSSTQRETCIVGVWRVLKKRSIVEENVATIDKERKKVRNEKKWMPIMTLIGGSTSLVSQCSPSWDEGSILQIYIRKSHLKRYCDGKWCLNLEGNYLQEAFKKPELCFTREEWKKKELVEEASSYYTENKTFGKFILDFQLVEREIGEDALNGCSSNLDKSFSRFDLEIV